MLTTWTRRSSSASVSFSGSASVLPLSARLLSHSVREEKHSPMMLLPHSNGTYPALTPTYWKLLKTPDISPALLSCYLITDSNEQNP